MGKKPSVSIAPTSERSKICPGDHSAYIYRYASIVFSVRILTVRVKSLPNGSQHWWRHLARRTNRLRDAFCTLARVLGGRAGARLCVNQATPACATTLLTLLRRQGLPAPPTPRVLGVDDWSFHLHQSATLLVDLERHQPVDVLLGSDEEVFADWLEKHPGVEIISRDRGVSYLKGATKGAPKAKQVLDRWHLCKNLKEVLQKALARQIDVLRQAGQESQEKNQDQPAAPASVARTRGRQRKPPRRKAPSPSPQRARASEHISAGA